MYSKRYFSLSPRRESSVLKQTPLLCSVAFFPPLLDWKWQAWLLIGFRDRLQGFAYKGKEAEFFCLCQKRKKWEMVQIKGKKMVLISALKVALKMKDFFYCFIISAIQKKRFCLWEIKMFQVRKGSWSDVPNYTSNDLSWIVCTQPVTVTHDTGNLQVVGRKNWELGRKKGKICS